ncbi:MAG: FAD-dependent oxidoreductase, partial [Acidimicrobiales bacterium]
MSAAPLPERARIVVIGGGAVGASVAYHLTQLGVKDIVLLEQGMLSSGTTWHAVGLVGQLRNTKALTQLIQYSTGLYSRLESETGLATGWKQVGSIMVARTQGRMESLRRMASLALSFGVDAEVVDPPTIAGMWPVARVEDLVGGVWLPGDGMVNPTDVTQSMARGARIGGARIVEGVRVEGIVVDRGAVAGVRTARGDIECEVLVNCAGQWAREVGRMAGVTVPLYPVEHMYVVSEVVAGVARDIPVLRDPDGRIYVREEIGGLIVGGFEPQAKPWRETVPPDFCFQLLEEDWEHFAVLMDSAIHRIPALEAAGIKKFCNGPESFTPDNQFVMGEAPGVRNMYVAAGFNSVGIASAGGAGMALSRWIVEGTQPFDLWPVDIRRFAPAHGNGAWLRTRVKEAVGHMYDIPWPNLQFHSGRMLRRSPVHHQLLGQGARFGDVLGWECADWFALEAHEPALPSFGRQEWFGSVEAEYRSCRETVGICDWSAMGKLRVHGPDASGALDHLCANDVILPVGSVVRTPVLNDAGGYESEVV